MELYQLQYFCTLYQCKHFGRAAEKLHISPATLTVAIKKLEKELEFPLIDRNTFALTEVGETLLKTSQKIFDELNLFYSEVGNIKKRKQVINLGIETFFLTKHFTKLLGSYLMDHPDIEVQLNRHSGSNMKENLMTGEVGLGIVIAPDARDEKFEYTDFCSVEYGLLMLEENPLSQNAVITPDQLENPFVKVLNLIEDIVAPLKDYFEKNNVSWYTGIVTDKDNERVKKLVANNLGVAIMPLDMEKLENTVIKPFDPPMVINYVFMNVQSNTLNKQTRQLIDYLTTNW